MTHTVAKTPRCPTSPNHWKSTYTFTSAGTMSSSAAMTTTMIVIHFPLWPLAWILASGLGVNGLSSGPAQPGYRPPRIGSTVGPTLRKNEGRARTG